MYTLRKGKKWKKKQKKKFPYKSRIKDYSFNSSSIVEFNLDKESRI